MGSLDLISKLPYSILHHILSLLDTEQACRASSLSWKWYIAWYTMPVLVFRPEFVMKTSRPGLKFTEDYYDDIMVRSYVELINETMQRYLDHDFSIKKFSLEFPMCDRIFAPSIDAWVRIAVLCGVEELNLQILSQSSHNYKLPEILFSANSLKKLSCRNVQLPYYKTFKNNSLRFLKLCDSLIDERMIEKILASCPLTDFKIQCCYGLYTFYIPWEDLSNDLLLLFGYTSMHCDVKVSTLENLFLQGNTDSFMPCNLNASALINLRNLELHNVGVTDEILSIVVSELSLLEFLVLSSCALLKNIEVSSKKLKKLHIMMCDKLEAVKINAPDLVLFRYNGRTTPSLSLINAQVHCHTVFSFRAEEYLSMFMFVSLKKFLLRSNIFKVMELDLAACYIEEEDFLEKSEVGSYRLEEVKLIQTCQWKATSSSVPAILDCLFWTCRPDVLTMHTTLRFNKKETFKFLLKALNDKVQSWKHPLKRIEYERADSSSLISKKEMEIKFKLYW